MRRSSLDRLREDLRLQQVYNTLLRYGMDAVLERNALRRRLPPRHADVGLAAPEGLGGAAGRRQAAAHARGARPDLREDRADRLEPGVHAARRLATELARLQDAVPPFPGEQVRETHHRGARGAAGRAVRLLRAAAVRGGLHGAGAPRHAARRHRGGRQGAAAQHHHQGPRRPRHPAERGARRRDAVRDGARRSTSSACSSSSRPACSRSSTTAARPTTRSSSPRTWRACPASTCR